VAIGTVVILLTVACGAALMISSLIVEGMPRRPFGSIFLSGFYILCLGSLATVMQVIVDLISA